MNKKISFLQHYFCLDIEEDFGYLVITEIVNDEPVSSFTVKVPNSFSYLPGIINYYSPSPN